MTRVRRRVLRVMIAAIGGWVCGDLAVVIFSDAWAQLAGGLLFCGIVTWWMVRPLRGRDV